MNIAEHMRDWLEKEGYDGLARVGCRGCATPDIGLCGQNIGACYPAKFQPCYGCYSRCPFGADEGGCYRPAKQGE